jgi:hypothetical protein
LFTNPDRHNSKRVCAEAIHATGFQVDVTAASARRKVNVAYLTEPMVWLEGADVASVRPAAADFTARRLPPGGAHSVDKLERRATARAIPLRGWPPENLGRVFLSIACASADARTRRVR